MSFSSTNRDTWPEVMTIQEVAEVLRRRPGGVAKGCQRRTFVPAPAFQYPRRWRKTDVVRHVDRGTTGQRRVQEATHGA
jgi:hypothetical protein